MPLQTLKEKIIPARFAKKQDWSNRHHVVSSKGNDRLPRTRRAYFDNSCAVQVKCGEFRDILAYQPWDTDDNGGYEVRLRRRFLQFPQFLSARGKEFSGQANGQTHSPLEFSSVLSRSATPSYSSGKSSTDLVSWLTRTTPVQPVTLDGLILKSPSTASEQVEPLQVQVKQSTRKAAQTSPARLRSELADAPLSEHFRHWCQAKRMNLVTLWRKLDVDGNMTLHKHEFIKGLAMLDYGSNKDRQQLWDQLDRDTSGSISFMEFAPEHAIDLARFKNWVTEKFGSIKALFRIMDGDGNGKISLQEFAQACQSHGMPQQQRDSIQKLFMLIDNCDRKADVGTITEAELGFLDVWKCPAYLWVEADHRAKNAFVIAMLNENGQNMFLAWRRALDKDGSMRVGFEEFTTACRVLARAGMAEAWPRNGIDGLYASLDHDRSGWFTLRDWDPDCHRLVFDFCKWVKQHYKKATEWVRLEEARGMEPGLSLNTFRRCVKSMEMTEDEEETLFEGLSLAPIEKKGKGRICAADVTFLDKWDPDQELADDVAWEKMADQRIGLETLKGTTLGRRGTVKKMGRTPSKEKLT